MSLKNPSWTDKQDKKLYDELFYNSDYSTLSDDEQDFCKTMYHLEEFATGLDG